MDQPYQVSSPRVSGAALVAIVCIAQVLAQIGASVWPALLPDMMRLWGLTYSEAAWITAIFLAAYMVAVPLLVPLTDRFDPRAVYLFGVGLTCLGHLLFGLLAEGFWTAFFARALTGIGWAGTYMTGLKLLADRVEGRLMSRATAGHAASIGISGALSFSFADVLAAKLGWSAPFIAAAASAGAAWLLVLCTVPRGAPQHAAHSGTSLFDFRPVLKNRSAMAYALTYCVHTLEYHAVRGWGVAFLGFVAASAGLAGSIVSPATVLTVLGILATVATVMGNELSIRFGRRRLIAGALLASIACAFLLGFAAQQSYWVAIVLILIYGFMISLDSSSLTAGTAGSAEPSRRGATLAVHSSLGYLGGFMGPLIIGWTLDLSGGMSFGSWAAAFSTVALFVLCSLILFRIMRPRELAGDRFESKG
ncbi:MAG: MFS transporter [Xanthobacteraceae bacterium]|nr:MFS transporter [Xanthobacteraceae bacterium]